MLYNTMPIRSLITSQSHSVLKSRRYPLGFYAPNTDLGIFAIVSSIYNSIFLLPLYLANYYLPVRSQFRYHFIFSSTFSDPPELVDTPSIVFYIQPLK